MELKITRVKTSKELPDDSKLGFGQIFTDHMFNMDYTPESGWHNARIEPYAPIVMDPATMVLHYGQAIFEGLKAYRTTNGKIQLFRPDRNMARLNRSAQLVCIPKIDEGFVLHALKKLISMDKAWVPKAPETSLYIRPTIVAMDPYLGVRPSHTYRFFIILSPVGAYYPEGFNPVKIWVTDQYVRAVKGGLGEAKTPANYAASLYGAEVAKKAGYTQVLWLDAVEHRYIEEVGTMNILFVINGEIVTPPLKGSILAGITRDSVLTLARHWNIPVTERPITINEVISAHKDGSLQEIFGSGTAAVISPVSHLAWQGEVLTIADGRVGPMAQKFYNAITDIQYGRAEDPFGWVVPVEEEE
ncbi:MAG: branched-chain amino acid aminotransferase [Deltaproteobacteria bacterium]|nr:branched-chain amino acid aminotransferase [Deltaproteobacteria bacterium]MBW2075771.1 branched-chain amino acid aminotransferase [Deltaproteobacteria bacterium]RLB81266.1 MAG: branched chain amino acid aminotransferase [Deltaproteobacteria bacterium]